MEKEKLIELAKEAREKAYAVYSNFKVGAALLTAEGQVFTGCNVENSSYGLTVCAERVTVLKAVSAGQTDFSILVVATDSSDPSPPCGACLQTLAEFSPNLAILTVNLEGFEREASLKELLPKAFSLKLRRNKKRG